MERANRTPVPPELLIEAVELFAAEEARLSKNPTALPGPGISRGSPPNIAARRVSRGAEIKDASDRGQTVTTLKESTLEAENVALREMVAQAGLDASRLLEQAGFRATERDAAERLQRLILEELHHRVKNTLATVMAITSQSLRNAIDLEHGRKSISDRLIALGRAHDLLLQSNWLSARLPAVVHASIEPFETIDNKRFVVVGADIDVGPAAVLALAMALNELCTNAVKYGALSTPGG